MLWIKAFHLIFMVIWFAGLFYLPRLFVYHAMATDTLSLERFKIMERKLYYGIMTPGMILTFVFGGWLLYEYAWLAYRSQGWLHAKLALLLCLVAYHLYCGHCRRKFAHNQNQHSHRFYRMMNEMPVLGLIAIVLLAVVRPF